MLDVGLVDRYLLELPRDIALPVKIPDLPKLRRVPESLVDKVRSKKKEPEKPIKEDEALKKAKKEISDAISELVEEMRIETRTEKDRFLSDEKRVLYALIDSDHKVMDYSKLEYGKIAQPLAIDFGYDDYTSDKKSSGISFTSEETISIKSVNRVIYDKVMSDLLKTTTSDIRPDERERFEYYKLFNAALITIKYDMAFA